MDRSSSSVVRPLREAAPLSRASRVLGALVTVVAALVLVGWMTGLEVLTTVVPGQVSMKVNTAVVLALLGLALVRPRARVVWPVVAAVLAVTLLTLGQYAAGVDLGIDELLAEDPGDRGGNPPGRMAPSSAASAAALALALAAARLQWVRLSRLLTVVPFTLGALALLGYAYRVEPLYAVASASAMAVPTAVLVILLAFGVDVAQPGTAVRAVLHDRGPVGTLLRTFGLVALVGLPVLGYVRLALNRADLIDDGFGVALMVILGAGGLIAATVHAAHIVFRAAAREARALEALRELNATLSEGRDAAWLEAEQLAAQLSRERQLFDQAISRVDDLVWTLRIGPETVDLVYASPGATGLFGAPIHAEVDVISAMSDMVHPDDVTLSSALEEAIIAGREVATEFRLIGYDGVERWLWVRGSGRVSDGERYYDGVSSNVTERRRLAERILELERERVVELEDTQRVRDQFFAMAGHELRTPLAVAGGYLTLVLDDPTLGEEHRRYLRVVLRSLTRTESLVSDLFDLARINAGIQRVERQPVDFAALVAEAVSAHERTARAAGVELRHLLPVSLRISADPERLLQIVDNLLSNAVKYTPRGGTVTVTLDEVDDETGPWARLRVRDTGIGIPDDEGPLVFDYLYRATTAITASIKGTGLGLALTKTLVEAHAGRIRIVPVEGPGAEFEVLLPRSTAIAQSSD